MTAADEPIPWHLHTGDVADAYPQWPTPAVIGRVHRCRDRHGITTPRPNQ
jgi:hypothetical protein